MAQQQSAPSGSAGSGVVDPSALPNVRADVQGDWTVDKALAVMAEDPPTEGAASPMPFFHFLERLKTTKRSGWRRFGLMHGESIADHQWRMAMMTMVAPAALTKRLDIQRCTGMALVHDMAEALVGDLTPIDGVPKDEKSRREAATVDYVARRLLPACDGGPDAAARIQALWREYEDSATPESIFVHDVDKVELLLQMVEYEKRGAGHVNLDEFLYVATKIQMPEMCAWADDIIKDRAVWWQAHGGPREGDGSGTAASGTGSG